MSAELISKTVQTLLEDLVSKRYGEQRDINEALVSCLEKKEKAHVRPLALRDSVLTLSVDSPAWVYVLNQKKPRLLSELRSRVGTGVVKDIRFRIGKVK